MISDGLWKRAFGSDPHIVGRSLRGDNDLYRVIGVMPPGFRDPGRTVGQRNTEQWAALGFSDDPAQAPNRSLRFAPGNGRAPEAGADGCSGADPAVVPSPSPGPASSDSEQTATHPGVQQHG